MIWIIVNGYGIHIPRPNISWFKIHIFEPNVNQWIRYII
jgi:hypothetical protein